MYISQFRILATCTASGATYFSEPILGGLLHAIGFMNGTASGIATGSTCILSAVSAATGPSVIRQLLTFTGSSANQFIFPRQEMQTTAGATAGALGGVMIPLVNDRIKLTIASGGASGNCVFDIYVEGR